MGEEKINYGEVGLKVGLEIHQQLDTGKLFCRCPSVLRQDPPDFFIKRKLHVVAGESGEIDKAAVYQHSLDKEFLYEGYHGNTCLVDLDEEPPHLINNEALDIAIKLSVFLNAEIFPLTQIMRKTVINGSNTSGFQRTVLIANNGWVETEKGRVGIQSICLEEDAARETGKKDNLVFYRLDRLGIPLIEIATSPDIKTPEQAKEVALKIGDILRSCKVKRGLGTIRQDVNISIKNSPRMEIKGVQDPDLIVRTINSEIDRLSELVSSGKKIEPEVRNALPDGKTEFLRPMPGAARMYPETDLPLLKISRDFINESKRNMPKLRREIEEELRTKGLNQEMIKLLFQEKMLSEFESLLRVYNNPNFIVKVIVLWKKEIATRENINEKEINEKLSLDILEGIIEKVAREKLKESDVKQVMTEIVKGKNLIDAMNSLQKKTEGVEEIILGIIHGKPGLSENAYMGLVMKEFKGKIDGKEAAEIIKKLMK